MCKVYTGYCGTSKIEHGLCACTVDNPLAKARGLSLRTGAQPMLYLSHGYSKADSRRCLKKLRNYLDTKPDIKNIKENIPIKIIFKDSQKKTSNGKKRLSYS